MDPMNDHKTAIRSFLARRLRVELADGDDFFRLGFVNSLFAMQLVSWVEKEFAITFEDEELDIANFHSIDAVNAFVLRKSVVTADV